eukprot:325099_1
MSVIAIVHHYVKPIGAIVSIIVISLLLKSLVSSFAAYDRKRATPKRAIDRLQIMAIITFITYILYNIGSVLGRWVFDVTACSVRVPMVSVFWCFTRAALYFFLLIRGEVSFAESAYAFNPIFIKAFAVFIVVTYLVYAICHVTTGHHIEFDEEDRVCKPTADGEKVVYGFTYPFLLVDFLIGVVICGMFARKLWLLQHQLDQSHRTNVDKNIDFIPAAKKQTKLAFVAYITSLLAMYIMPATKFFSFPFVDTLINALCVYCTFRFEMPVKLYRYLCECGGNKCCLCVFCFCCWCCNVPSKEVKVDGLHQGLEQVASNEAISSEDDRGKPSSVDVVSIEATVDTSADATATTRTVATITAAAST